MYTEPSDVSHTFTFFTLSGSDQIFSDHLNYISQKDQKHNLGLFVNLVLKKKRNVNIGLTTVFRLLRPETLVPHGLQVGLKASSAEERHTGSLELSDSDHLVLSLSPDSSSRFLSMLRQLSSWFFQTSTTPE